jgi:hypothetical protein
MEVLLRGVLQPKALLRIMDGSQKNEQFWLLYEIFLHHIPAKCRCFPKEAARPMREALVVVLSLTVSLTKTSPLALTAWASFVLFPKVFLRPLPNGCQGSFATTAFNKRCKLLMEGNIDFLLAEAHEAQTERIANSTRALSEPDVVLPQTAKAASLARLGEVGRACKVPFSYGMERDPTVATKFLSKLTLKNRHAHIMPYIPKINPIVNLIPIKAVTDAFLGMPKKVCRAKRWLDLGTSSGRGSNGINGSPSHTLR